MTRLDVIWNLSASALFRGNWRLDDNAYDALSSDFVALAWAAWVASLPDELVSNTMIGGGKTKRVPAWLPEVWDCDNGAKDFAVFLDRCCAVDAVKIGRTQGNSAPGVFDFCIHGDQILHNTQFFS